MKRKEAEKIRSKIVKMAESITDEEILEYPVFVDKWVEDGCFYPQGARVRYGAFLYKCLQDHISQTTWTPEATPSLWAKIINEDPSGGIPVWEQPDSTNPYMRGDKVHYPGASDPVYESLIDNNVWSPEAYPAGWKEITE